MIHYDFLLAVKYLARLYCICLVSNNLDPTEMVDIDFEWMHAQQNFPQLIQLKYEAFRGNQNNIDDLVRLGIDNGCQVISEYITISPDNYAKFENIPLISRHSLQAQAQ